MVPYYSENKIDHVLVDADILIDLISLTVVDYGCLAGRRHSAERDLRGGSQYAFERAENRAPAPSPNSC